MTTLSPAASARAAAASLITPICSQTDLAPAAIASVDRLAGRLGSAEDVDHVDRLADLGELAPDKFAVDMFAGDLRIDRQYPVAPALEVRHHAVAGAVRTSDAPIMAIVRVPASRS
jgi:hypothetical protein